MKIALQYVNDSKGQTQAVQVPIVEWEKIQAKLRKYEQALKLKADLIEAFAEVKQMRKTKGHKQTLNEFLDAL